MQQYDICVATQRKIKGQIKSRSLEELEVAYLKACKGAIDDYEFMTKFIQKNSMSNLSKIINHRL